MLEAEDKLRRSITKFVADDKLQIRILKFSSQRQFADKHLCSIRSRRQVAEEHYKISCRRQFAVNTF